MRFEKQQRKRVIKNFSVKFFLLLNQSIEEPEGMTDLASINSSYIRHLLAVGKEETITMTGRNYCLVFHRNILDMTFSERSFPAETNAEYRHEFLSGFKEVKKIVSIYPDITITTVLVLGDL